MRKFEAKVYPALIKTMDGDEMDVEIAVVEKGVPFEAYWNSWIDEKTYFTLTAEELEELQVGDELSEGDYLISIDKVDPSIWEAEYDPAEYNEEEECF